MKNGRTAARTQRWRRADCGASSVHKREDVTRRHQLIEFLTWLIGKHSQSEVEGGSTGRSLRHRTAWCWSIQPRLGTVETTHHQILVDGPGIASAIRQSWPNTKIQRCLFHVQMNIRQHLTLNPHTDAGRRLLALSRALSRVHTVQDAIDWQINLDLWWRAHGHLTRERTIRDGRWWFTHDRLRKAWSLLRKLTRDGVVFTYLEHGNTRTTSPLEGGINNGIRHVLRAHRGMTEDHMKRAAEWFLTLHEIPLERAHELITTTTPAAPSTTEADEEEHIEPSPYDTGLSADEGLWIRSGWAGRA